MGRRRGELSPFIFVVEGSIPTSRSAHFVEQALNDVRAGHTKVFASFEVPDDAIGCGFHEAVRGLLSHHLVIRDGKIANYHPYPPLPADAVERQPA